MTIRNRLLVLLLLIGLTPLVLTSLMQQVSIRLAGDRLAADARGALEAGAKEELQEQLRGHAQILDRDRELTDALLSRQVREVELRLARLTPPPRWQAMGRGFDPAGPGMGGPPAGPGPRDGETEPRPRQDGPGAYPRIDPNGLGQMQFPFRESGIGRGEPGSGFRMDWFGRRGIASSNLGFGYDPNLPSPAQAPHPYFETRMDPNSSRQAANYQAQSCFVTQGSDANAVAAAMADLSDMTPAYHEVYSQGPKGTLWLHTNLRIGLSTTYPGGVTPLDPCNYDPSRYIGPGRRGPWARRASAEGEPVIDPFTEQVVVIRSLPVHYLDGSPAGDTVMARTVPEVFESMELPARWGAGVKRMLISVDPNAGQLGPPRFGRGGRGFRGSPPKDPGPWVLLRDDIENRVRRGQPGPIQPELLQSDNRDLLAAMVTDIQADKPGVQVMVYEGQKCLWAYHPLGIPKYAALLIVPYQSVVGLSATMEKSLLKEGMFWLQGMTMILLAVGIIAVVLAALKARSVTNPIHALIEAGRKLGNGDYDARVEIRTGDEFENLGRVFNEAGPKLRDQEKMKRSLDLAAATQQSLLPSSPPVLEHFEIAGRCLYCDETGGDYYDFIDLSIGGSRRIGLASGDVSGHGIGAALLMAATRGMLHADAEHHRDDLSSLIQSLNTRLTRDAVDGQFITLFYGILSDSSRSLTWVSAGHEPAIWVHGSSGQAEDLANTGLPLGVERHATFEQAEPVVLEPGDILVLSTDGIREARNKDDEFFGRDRLVQVVRDKAGLSASEICDAVIAAVTQFVSPAPRTDDITLVIVKAR